MGAGRGDGAGADGGAPEDGPPEGEDDAGTGTGPAADPGSATGPEAEVAAGVDADGERESDLRADLDAAAEPSGRSGVVRRIAFLVGSAVVLYLLAPSLLSTLASVEDLAKLSWWWFPPILGAQALSFVCVWQLQRIALRTQDWFAVATSQVAGNAFSRIVPGGAAAGVALQYRMLGEAGIPTTTAASSLTAVSILTTGVVLGLPILALPAILGGTPVDNGLVRAAWLGALVFVVIVTVGAALLFSDRALDRVARAAQWVGNRLRRNREPVDDLPARLLEERDLVRDTLQANWLEALLAAAGRSLFDYTSLLLALLAVGAHPNPSLVLLAFVAAQVLSMIPITPGGIGFVEAGLTATLALAGVPGALAVVATLAYRMASYWLPLVAGVVAMRVFRRRYPSRAAA